MENGCWRWSIAPRRGEMTLREAPGRSPLDSRGRDSRLMNCFSAFACEGVYSYHGMLIDDEKGVNRAMGTIGVC